ncbi:hypothetical protein FRC08_015055 [Ceratobasidium sp. 394]|nr:hypothetical protein FRC08_015055 [Ceratobasidium sp. 394]KAG9100195.1 hypothetical protein FS749_015976 [Ceratobasidium sp. UAMH 11750]
MSTPHARNIVRKLLAGGRGLRMQEIYKRGLEEYPATPFPEPPPAKRFPGKGGILKPAPPQPPNPRHPFRSHSYLKCIVLPDLAASREVEKFHTTMENTGEIQTRKRATRSKEAIGTGRQDVWLWRLIGPQAKEDSPKLEEEPEVNTVEWYQENQIYPRPENPETSMSGRDPYGAGPWTHLNKRRQNARPEKIRLEQEWIKSVAAARKEGSQTMQNPREEKL